MQCAYTSDLEEILMFKTFKGFKKQVACRTAKTNRNNKHWVSIELK
jgi:hypothetical protein